MSQQDSNDRSRRASPAKTMLPSYSDFFSSRARKQLALFFAGASFFVLSTAITRRALVRKYKAVLPAFFHQTNRAVPRANGPREAVEALNLATLNVFSVALMTTGGVLWAFDISSLDELRTRVRAGMGIHGTEQEANEEIEEWIASTLARKDGKQRELERRAEQESKSLRAAGDRGQNGNR
ncbi:MAG: hypothetical protein M1815_004076 [Lichina confinis]|nr:MAG: hypothetical protein M1815_004076 [Lichina confinis]